MERSCVEAMWSMEDLETTYTERERLLFLFKMLICVPCPQSCHIFETQVRSYFYSKVSKYLKLKISSFSSRLFMHTSIIAFNNS